MSSDEFRSRVLPVPREDRALHLPAPVASAIDALPVDVFTVDDDASDTDAFSARYGIALDDCANTLVVRYRKDGTEHHAAIVTLGSRRLDVNGAVKAVLAAQRLSFAKREVAVELTGMASGGITAFGLPSDWRVLVDAAVTTRREVVMGAGVRTSKLLLAPAVLTAMPGVTVAALTIDG